MPKDYLDGLTKQIMEENLPKINSPSLKAYYSETEKENPDRTLQAVLLERAMMDFSNDQPDKERH